MGISIFFKKVKNKLRLRIICCLRTKSYYPKIYKSYWYSIISSSNNCINNLNYYTAIPNRGAGIGHQMANWIAGYWYSKQFGLMFAHIPFSDKKWENILGFGEGETSIEELLQKGYREIRLPLFNEFDPMEVYLIKKIIGSYRNKRVVFVAEQDQFYRDQFGVMEEIKSKFYSAKARKNDRLIYSKENFNIAIHVRRGDIVSGMQKKNPNLIMRWQGNSYFEKILSTVVDNIKPNKPIFIYLFSEGTEKDFSDFEKFENIQFCLEMGAQDSFLHMVYADLLITSKSSFSYKPALLSHGIKVCPRNFWHGYPDKSNFVLADDDGNFEIKKLKTFFSNN